MARHLRPSEATIPKEKREYIIFIATIVGVVVAIIGVIIGYLAYQHDLANDTNRISSPPTCSRQPGNSRPLSSPTCRPPKYVTEDRSIGGPESQPIETLQQSSLYWKYNDESSDEITYIPVIGLTMGSGKIVTLETREATYASYVNASGYAKRTFERPDLITGD